MSRDTTPYEVLIDERVEKDLEDVPKHVVDKFLKLLDEFEKNPIRPRTRRMVMATQDSTGKKE